MSDVTSGYEVFWNEAVHQIGEKISEQEFLMWFRNMDYLNSRDSQIVVAVPSSFYKDQVTQRFLPTLETTLFELSGQKLQVMFKVQRTSAQKESAQKEESAKSKAKSKAKKKSKTLER